MANSLAWIATSSPLTCQQWISQTVQDAGYFLTTIPAQFIQVASPVVVCTLKAYISDAGVGAPVDCIFTIRSASNRGGSILATTNTATSTGGGLQLLTLTFASNPTISADCFITWESATLGGVDQSSGCQWRYNTAGGYDGTTYCAYIGTFADTTSDFYFEVWTMQ